MVTAAPGGRTGPQLRESHAAARRCVTPSRLHSQRQCSRPWWQHSIIASMWRDTVCMGLRKLAQTARLARQTPPCPVRPHRHGLHDSMARTATGPADSFSHTLHCLLLCVFIESAWTPTCNTAPRIGGVRVARAVDRP